MRVKSEAELALELFIGKNVCLKGRQGISARALNPAKCIKDANKLRARAEC